MSEQKPLYRCDHIGDLDVLHEAIGLAKDAAEAPRSAWSSRKRLQWAKLRGL